jgi:heptosyltransferase I
MLSALGDAIQALPVLVALRRSFPKAHISWVLEPGPHTLVAGHPAVDEFVVFRSGGRKGVLETGRAIRSTATILRQEAANLPGSRYDLLIDLQVYLKAGLLTALTPATVKLGFDGRRARDLNRLFTTHRIPAQPGGHTQDQYLEFLTHIGVDPEPFEYGLTLTEEEQEAQTRFFAGQQGPVCGLVLATSRQEKDWHAAGYAQVIRELQSRFGMIPVFLGGDAPREDAMAAAVQDLVRGRVLDARGGGIRRLLWLLAGCRLIVSPDTGPLHIAHAMGVPVVGLFGATDPQRYRPYRGDPRLVVDGYARFPGEAYPPSRKRRPGGMLRIGPEKVLEAVEVALEE